MTENGVSCFFVKESLPLYMAGRLKPSRFESIQAHLKTCKTCASELRSRELAKVALEQLAHTTCSKEVLQFLKEEHTFWKDFRSKYGWAKWSSNAKWAAELALVGVALAVTVNVFPWLNLARTFKHVNLQREWENRFGKSEVGEKPVAENQPLGQETLPVYGPQLPPGGLPTPKPHPAVELAAHDKPAPPTNPVTAEEEGQNDQTPAKAQKGFVWRGSLRVDTVTPELIEKLKKQVVDLGGTKAGKVDLGWRNEKNQPYYHFIIPQSNYDKFLGIINTEGYAELKKENHPRVIKQGYMRIIMIIEEEP
ncbi:MAG: hypothetical protein IT289_08015 [Oligoflexia bacterium]|nr:hypothetical protein [Oligoflexia bacterium]